MISKKTTKHKFSLGNTMINIVIIFVLFAFGLAILIPHFYPKIIARNKTTAQIIKMVNENRTFIDKDGSESENIYYYPVISYMANGQEYITNYNIDSSYSKNYDVGDAITVFYNPKNPEQHYSVEERNGKMHLLVLIFGIFITLFGILLTYSFITMNIIPYIKFKMTDVNIYENIEDNVETNDKKSRPFKLKLKKSTLIIISIMPLLLLTIGSAIIISHFKIRMVAKNKTTAEIVHIIMQKEEETYKDSNDNTRTRDVINHYPVIRYTANGQETTIKHNLGQGNTSKYKAGDVVTLYYNAENPKQYYIKGYYKGISPFLVLGIFLVFFMVPLIIHIIKEFIKSQ